MPVSGTFIWEEKDCHVLIEIPLKGCSSKKVDVLVVETYLKISYPPFFLEFDLLGNIDVQTSKAVNKNGLLCIKLVKATEVLWGGLMFDGAEEEKLERRRTSLEKHRQYIAYQHERTKVRRIDEERLCVKNQMDLEQNERNTINKLKQEHKRAAEETLYDDISKFSSNWGHAEISSDECSQHQQPQPMLVCSREDQDKSQSDKICDIDPLPRSASLFLFKHTPRAFKTPSRESTSLQERNFIAKNRPFLRKNNHFNRDGLDISHTDPVWLKKRGDRYYNSKDYWSAINAYSASFEQSDTYIPSLMNRSTCYLQLREPMLCISDCIAVQKLLEGGDTRLGDEERRFTESKNLARMGCAYFLVGDFEKASVWLERAVQINPSDKLYKYTKRVKVIFKAQQLKQNADKLLAAGNIDGAIDMYEKSIAVDETFVSAMANHATLVFSRGQFYDCIVECSNILSLLICEGSNLKSERSENGILLRGTPCPGTSERHNLLVTVLCKRGCAYIETTNFNKACEDLSKAKKILGKECSSSMIETGRLIDIMMEKILSR